MESNWLQDTLQESKARLAQKIKNAIQFHTAGNQNSDLQVPSRIFKDVKACVVCMEEIITIVMFLKMNGIIVYLPRIQDRTLIVFLKLIIYCGLVASLLYLLQFAFLLP